MDARVVSKAIVTNRSGAEDPASGCFHSVTSSNFVGVRLDFSGRTLAEKQMHLRIDDEHCPSIRAEAYDVASCELFGAGMAEWAEMLEPRGIRFWSGATGECAQEARAACDAAALPGGAEETGYA